MEKPPSTTPVKDTVAKIDGDLAVGEDLEFQRRWWIFERIIWAVFVAVIVCDVIGLFGHGWLAKAKAGVPDRNLTIEYERIERASSPSTMLLHFGPGAIHDGRIQVFLSDSVVRGLGALRIAPQPAVSAIGQQGITYTFAATGSPAQIEVQLEPTEIGLHTFQIRLPGEPAITAHVFVLP